MDSGLIGNPVVGILGMATGVILYQLAKRLIKRYVLTPHFSVNRGTRGAVFIQDTARWQLLQRKTDELDRRISAIENALRNRGDHNVTDQLDALRVDIRRLLEAQAEQEQRMAGIYERLAKVEESEWVYKPIPYEPYPINCKVLITDPKSAYCGQVGTVIRKGDKGGLWVRHTDGGEAYHPWGYGRAET